MGSSASRRDWCAEAYKNVMMDRMKILLFATSGCVLTVTGNVMMVLHVYMIHVSVMNFFTAMMNQMRTLICASSGIVVHDTGNAEMG